jgi:signal transduction histidine kinase
MGVGVVLVLMLMSWSVGVDGRRAVWWAWLVMAGISAVVVLFGDPDNAALQVLLTVLPAWAGHAWSEGDREQRAAQASTDQAQSDIDRAVAAAVRRERLRVARDLHDVTSHALGVMVLHAGAAAAQCRTDPARARLSLQIVQDTGRGALGDLGRLVGLIDAGALGVTGADAAVLAGEPADLPDRLAALAQRIRHTGAEVRLRVPSWSGSEPSPDGELGQVCFRIVQEALTNVVRHAPGSRVAVVLDRSGEGWRLEVTDDGARPRNASGTGGSGFGLVGAAERVLALGGEFRAGPAPTGGWAVRAWIPAAAAVPAEVVTPEGLP